MDEKIKGLVRHALTVAGTVLVTKGVIDEAMLTEVVGAVITLTSLYGVLSQRKKRISNAGNG